MMDRPQIESEPTPTLSEAGLAAAREVADWCEAQHEAVAKTASLQLRYVWWLVGAGIVALLLLPLVIEFIDYRLRERAVPQAVVENANDAVTLLTGNLEKLKADGDDLAVKLGELDTAIKALEDERGAIVASLRQDLASPYSVWRIANIEGREGGFLTIADLHRHADGRYLAAGVMDGAAVLSSEDGLNWVRQALNHSRADISGSMQALGGAPGGPVHAVGSGNDLQNGVIFREAPAQWARIATNAEGGLPTGSLFDVAANADGAVVVVGTAFDSSTQPMAETPLLLVLNDPGGGFEAVAPPLPPGATGAALFAADAAPDGVFTVAGRFTSPDGQAALVLSQGASGAWLTRPSPFAGDRATISRLKRLDGRLYATGAVGSDRWTIAALHVRDAPGTAWRQLVPPETGEIVMDDYPAQLFDLAAGSDGVLVAVGEGRDGGDPTLLWLADEVWRSLALERPDGRWFSSILAVEARDDGSLMVGGQDLLAVQATERERTEVLRRLLSGVDAPPPIGIDPLPGLSLDALILPAGTFAGTERRRAISAEIATLAEQRKTQAAFLAAARELESRQQNAIATVTSANAALEDALRTAEPVRQAISMATRIALIALLIFLVQIVVNRYRYLQRLAGFYRARSQAFRMVAATPQGEGAPMLRGVTLTEMMASLSPDAIGFDKAADPPTHHVATLLQAALKK